MVAIAVFRKFAMSFDDVIELPHFEKASFRVNKKIFSTIDERKNIAMVKLSLIDQSVFCDMNKGAIYPVPGGWGKQGATYIDLKKVKLSVLQDAMRTSYNFVLEKNKRKNPSLPKNK